MLVVVFCDRIRVERNFQLVYGLLLLRDQEQFPENNV
jgi:hypothetical protein